MPTDKNNTTMRSLKPPREWFDKKVAEIKKGNPDYSDEQVNATVGKIWYREMSKHQRGERRHEEGKEYGKAPMQKSTSPIPLFGFIRKSRGHNLAAEQEMTNHDSSVPAIVCEYFGKDGSFEELRVVTASEVLESPDKYDSKTFALLIRNLGRKLIYEYQVDDQLKCTQVIIDLAEELESRIKEEKEARKKLQEENQAKETPAFQNNWQKKKEYFMGKSIMNLPLDEDGIEDYLSDAEIPNQE
jgi:hypothetical protein